MIEYPLRLSTDFEYFARPTSHQRMLLDQKRLQAFASAIQVAVKPGDRVIDLGAGTGVLSLMAAEAGASHVLAIEGSSLAKQLEQIVSASKFADVIEVCPKRSTDVHVDEAYDVLISETLGHIGIDEGILSVVEDAAKRLLKPGAHIVPNDVKVKAAAVYHSEYDNEILQFWNFPLGGYDLSPMAALASTCPYVLSPTASQRMSGAHVLKTFDVGRELARPYEIGETIPNLKQGTINGFLLGFDSQVAEGVMLDSWQCHSWRAVFLPIPSIKVLGDEQVTLNVTMLGDDGKCSWRGSVSADESRSFHVVSG